MQTKYASVLAKLTLSFRSVKTKKKKKKKETAGLWLKT